MVSLRLRLRLQGVGSVSVGVFWVLGLPKLDNHTIELVLMVKNPACYLKDPKLWELG